MNHLKTGLTVSTYGLLAGSVLCQSLSLACGKQAGISESTSIVFLFVNTWYIGMLFFLGMQAVFWNATLKFIPLSFAYPFNSLSILLTAIFGILFFSETLSPLKTIGILTIIFGVFITTKNNIKVAHE